MKRRFRLAYNIKAYFAAGDRRPAKPVWLKNLNNRTHGFNYWTKIYYATPPWLDEEQINEMREIYEQCPEGYHVDHIVPLKSPLVCGLHASWNLQYLPEKMNLAKSNHTWPDHPFENLDLFAEFEPQQLRLV